MDTHLIIDLEKSWREDLHPRDKMGKFSTVRGGSPVVTNKGQRGRVSKVTDTHYHVTTDDGKRIKVKKDNAIHAADHEKAMKQIKKQKTRRNAAQKATVTKAKNKANGHGKAKTLKDPTATTKKAPKPKTALVVQKERVKNMEQKARKENKAIREAKKTRDIAAPDLIRKKIVSKPKDDNKPAMEAVKEYKNVEDQIPEGTTVDGMWSEPHVQKLLAKHPSKRSIKDIRKVAGAITEANDKLARHVVNKRASALGIPTIYNYIGTKASRPESVKAQETGFYGDMLQSARASMFETLHNVLAGTDNPREGMSIGRHVTSRMKHKLHRDMYGLLNSIPAPHAIRQAIGDSKKAENELSQALGRTPTHDEVAEHLQNTSKAFRESPIMQAPRWDEKKNDWVATNKRVEDPSERLQLLKNYAGQQRTASADVNVGKEGERDVHLSDSVPDQGRTPEEIVERKERQKELEGALPKAMTEMGMSPAAIKVFTTMYSQPSEAGSKPHLTAEETADKINAAGGWEGKPIGGKWVHKHLTAGRKAVAEALANNHPALAQLAMLKSLTVNMILKGVYEYDLVKSLHGWGLDTTVLVEDFKRMDSAENLYDLRKSLMPTEYVGSYVVTDTGQVQARIVELALPESHVLHKSFKEFGEELKKSLFPHKGDSNHAINQKATEYIKGNKSKYAGVHKSQHDRINAKKASGKQLTWSEELAIKENGFWITWGGKKILVSGDPGSFGEVKYDSRNEAHREEHNEGAQEDKIDFHHENDELDAHKEALEKEANEGHAKGDYKINGKTNKKNWAKAHGVKWDDEKGDFDTDDDGKLQFDHSANEDDHRRQLDHGLKAFGEEQAKLADKWSESKNALRDEHGHKVHEHYTNMTDDERKAYDAMSPEERAKATGEYHLGKGHIKNRLDEYREAVKNAGSDEEKRQLAEGLVNDLKAMHKEHKDIPSSLINTRAMLGRGKGFGGLAQQIAEAPDLKDLAPELGNKELAESRTQAGKSVVKAGKYIVGNPETGKQLIVSVDHAHMGGRGGKGGKFTSIAKEAFNPDTGEHFTFDGDTSWGELAHHLGFSRSTSFAEDSNKAGQPMMKEISDDEFAAARKNTRAGLRDDMTHKDFRLVDQSRDKDGNVKSSTYAMDMPDGTQNVIEVDGDGFIKDPIMARLVKQDKAIKNADDLHEALTNAVGNTAWVTAHAGSDIHIGDALGHHVKLLYDGKGAPKVVGGAYDGYRFMDQKDVPKGAIDPTTGEPIKALFKNGKLVDRKFTTTEKVPMEVGNDVKYKSDSGTWRKGHIVGQGEGGLIVKHADGTQSVYKKDQLQNATKEGRMQSKSGQAVVKLAKNGTHRFDTSSMFDDSKHGNKAKELFKQALGKAKIHQGVLDKDGNLNKELELSDQQLGRLKKVLGRSKAGKDLLGHVKSNYMKELEIHVPEDKRAEVESEGVKVKKDGTARISAAKFEHLRDVLGGLSMTRDAREHMKEHFQRKDRTPKSPEELRQGYQSFDMKNQDLKRLYTAQLNPKSFLAQRMVKGKDGKESPGGLYSTQLEGLAHLVERKNAIAGHGMGTGKTILGVTAALHYKASQLLAGKKPKKTLIVSPAGIQSDWGKEITDHTNSKALFVGSESKLRKKDENGNWMRSDNGRHMFGQDGKEHEAVSSKHFLKNMETLGKEDHDFHVMSYDQFMKMRDELANSGMYGNIVIDEVHAFKNQKGKRGKSLAETTSKFSNVWGLSGTPMENDAREIYSLIDTVTGGKHALGTEKEFRDNYMQKDRNGKITGVKASKSKELGDIIANVVQFRGGQDVKFNDGSQIKFPHLVGSEPKSPEDNPKLDFVGDLADRSRDHATNDYYGTKHSVVNFVQDSKTLASKSGENYDVRTFQPKNLDNSTRQMYERYNELQAKYLPDSKLNELATAAVTGYDTGKKGKSNYLTAMQKLQKYLNTPLAEKMYVEGGNAIESDATDAQSPTAKKGGGLVEGKHYTVDKDGFKRYFEADGNGGYVKNADGSPKLLPPLHRNNPKAQYLQGRINTYLDHLARENESRRQSGKPELMPKVVVKSSYTTFGTDIVDNVLKDVQRTHPELQRWAGKLKSEGKELGAGRFTGDADDREDTKTGFRGNKNDYASNQGHLWATTVSPAGKEGVDFGNAHYMIHYDQDWNPQKMAQFTARVRRSDSHKGNASVDRSNSVRVESLHMPGTVEDFMFDAEDAKMNDINKVTEATREKEKARKFGDTAAGIGRSHRGFTRGKNNRAGAKPKRPMKQGAGPATIGGEAGQKKVAMHKSVKFVIKG